jgi:hypothetical protein
MRSTAGQSMPAGNEASDANFTRIRQAIAITPIAPM